MLAKKISPRVANLPLLHLNCKCTFGVNGDLAGADLSVLAVACSRERTMLMVLPAHENEVDQFRRESPGSLLRNRFGVCSEATRPGDSEDPFPPIEPEIEETAE